MKNITPALAQLTTLGYQDGDRVYVRTLLPKNIPLPEALKLGIAWQPEPGKIIPVPVDGYLTLRQDGVTFTKLKRCKQSGKWIEKRVYYDGLAYLHTLNQKGYGIYYIVNAGGRENGDITRCPALFYECDGISKDEQWRKIDELTRLGYQPSLIIETRNSLHVYHRTIEQGVEGWRELQQRLIQRQESDSSIHNENRLMRLAGFLHWKWNDEAQALESFPVTLKLNTGKVYNRAELDSFLPLWDVELWNKQSQQAKRIATDPSLEPWDIRNLATMLDGYRPDGRRGWDTCKCPAHNGESDNSLHIEQSTGAYKCHGGCDSKEVYHAALELAKSRGYQVPKKRTGHRFVDLGGWLFKLNQQLAQTVKRRNNWGFGRNGKVTLEEVTKEPPPAIEYQNGERLDVWGEAVKRGVKFILDVSPPGTGKSYDAGRLTPNFLGAAQVIYACSEHRNRSTPTFGGWPDLEARHGGLVRDAFGKLRRAKPNEPYIHKPNCERIGTINVLLSKNIQPTHDTVCTDCINSESCRGNGFLSQRYNLLGENYELKIPKERAKFFTAHPQSLPSPFGDDEHDGYRYSDVTVAWDEASEILKAHRSFQVREHDLKRLIADLALKFPEVFDRLRPLLTELHRCMSGEQKQPNKYGWNDTQLRGLLPKLDGIDLEVINEIREALKPDLSFLNTTAEYGVNLSDLPRQVRKNFSDSDATAAEKAKQDLALNWLPDFLNVLLGNTIGHLRMQNDVLTITLPAYQLVQIAGTAQANIFLDATASAEDLARVLGIDPSEILTVRQALPDTNNLEVIQIATMGRLGVSSRRKNEKGENTFLQQRLDALIAKIQEDTSGKMTVIDFKRFTEDGDGKRRWWTDSRGVNDLEDCNALGLVGTPCRNLADLEAEFTVLFGRSPKEGTARVKYPIQVNGAPKADLQPWFEMEVSADPEFRSFCRRRILADIHQAIGRLRAHRRPGQQFKVYIIGDYPLDVPVTLKMASEITPDAATKTERVGLAIRAAVQQLKATGQKVTQQAIAAITGVTQGYVSRFRELLQTLLSDSNSKSNNLAEPPPDPEEVQWIGKEYLPLLAETRPPELLEEVLSVFEVYGREVWQQIWDHTPASVQIKILTALMFTLNAGELRSLATTAEVRT